MSFKKPKSGGIKKARESFEKFIKQQPSDWLVQIVQDVLVENERARKKPGVVVQADTEKSTANNRTCKNSNSTVKYRTDRLMK